MRSGIRSALSGALLLALTVLPACNVVRITLNKPLSPEHVSFIVPGQTTFSEVVASLGAPDALTESASGFVATYRFLDLKYSRVNFGWLLRPWSPVDPDLVISRTGLGTEALQVVYNADGIVTQHGFLRHLSGPRFNPYPF
ncbi:MAG TPA: hypothetical protein VFS39_17275 [Nitrospira sp.]|nr:hypothetical protein [Nitrospira sp.]